MSTPAGFLSTHFSALPVAVKIIITLCSIVIGTILCFLAPYASRWGTHMGIHNDPSAGEKGSSFRLAGGVLGLLSGAVGLATLVLLLTYQVLSTQSNPALSPWAIIAIGCTAGLIGAIFGGRWRIASRLLLTFQGAVCFTLLCSTSLHIKAKTGRLIILAIVLIITLVLSFAFSLVGRTALQRIATRTSFVLASSSGAWIALAVGVDIWTKTGLFDAVTLLVSDRGVLQQGRPEHPEQIPPVVLWGNSACKGLLAGIWLLFIFGTVFQQWRYSVIGDDPDDSWNSYLGSMLTNEKLLMAHARNGARAGNSGSMPLMLDNNRAGIFSKPVGFWRRLFSPSRSSAAQRRRYTPSEYELPSEQSNTLGGQSDMFLYNEETKPGMQSYSSRDSTRVTLPRLASSQPPAKYDSVGRSTVGAETGFGLYDDAREAYYSYDARDYQSHLVTTPNLDLQYDPETYQLPHNVSEPSFTSVPKYSPPRLEQVNNTSMPLPTSASPQLMRDTIVEEPEEVLLAPISPQARATEDSESNRRDQRSASVPILATPSLVNAIKRVSQAQEQARSWHDQAQQQDLPTRTSAKMPPFRAPSNISDSERTALQQAAKRRQASAEWWSEVERKASEGNFKV